MQGLVTRPGRRRTRRGSPRLPAPRAGAGQLLLRVLEVGVCGTDREISEGVFGVAPDGDAELVLGHELLGVVDARRRRFLARRPRHRDRAPLVRPLPRLRGGLARLVPHRRLQRARHHPPRRLRARARRGGRGAADPHPARRSAGSACSPSRRRSASVRSGMPARSATASRGSSSARSCSAQARSACSRPICCGSPESTCGRPASSRRSNS